MTVTGGALAAIALAAGAEIMRIYRTDFGVSHKSDRSVLTEADGAAEAVIVSRLTALDPGLQVIAEEAVADGHMPEHGSRFALVDPLDGTREFVAKNGEFTVNIAIIEHGRPVMGVVYAPALERLFVAESPSEAWQARAECGGPVPSERLPLRVRPAPDAGLTAIASRSHRSPETDEWLSRYPVSEIKGAGSALKFCLVGAGEADLYPRHGRTMEWDTAAGQAIVEAAGGRVLTLDGAPLLYGKRERGYDNPHFVVYGDVTPR
jgi:3'(2'), 5'-bisphosphate nucleotidase